MNAISNIAAAFDALVPGIEADYIDYVKRTWKRLHENYDAQGLRKLANSSSNDGAAYRNVLRPYKKSEPGNYKVDAPYTLNEERLAKDAKEYAELQVARFVAKLTKKLQDLDTVEEPVIRGRIFTLNGTMGGRKVHVDQDQILKVSPKGNLFNQWPARIYVDGKFISEAQFKKLGR